MYFVWSLPGWIRDENCNKYPYQKRPSTTCVKGNLWTYWSILRYLPSVPKGLLNPLSGTNLLMNFKIYEKLPRLGLHAGILEVSFIRTGICDLSLLGLKHLPTERHQELNFIRVKHCKHISSHYHSTEKPFQVERYSKFQKNSIYTFASLSYPWVPPKNFPSPKLMASEQKVRGKFPFLNRPQLRWFGLWFGWSTRWKIPNIWHHPRCKLHHWRLVVKNQLVFSKIWCASSQIFWNHETPRFRLKIKNVGNLASNPLAKRCII